MRTCKCGKANQPTRKFCVRCGESLIKSEEELAAEKAATVAAAAPSEPAPAAQPTAAPPPRIETPTESPPTSREKSVRPSEVPKDRLRTTSPSVGLSEMEKAKAAFSKAEEVGIDEESGDGIVETRMLRASEVRELMEVIEKQNASPEPAPAPAVAETPVAAPAPQPVATTSAPPVTPPATPPMSEPAIERTPTAVAPSVAPPASSPPKPLKVTPAVKPPSAQPPVPESKPEDIAPKLKTEEPKEDVKLESSDLEPYLSKVADPSFYQDGKIKDYLEDVARTLKELRLAETDLAEVETKLEDDSRQSRNVSETKRIEIEALEEKMRLTKQEWDAAKKAYDLVEKRKKSEISTRQNRIKSIKKNLDKTVTLIERRNRVLSREKGTDE